MNNYLGMPILMHRPQTFPSPSVYDNHKTHDYVLLPVELVDVNCVVLNSILDDKARGLLKESESLGCCLVYFRSVWREALHASTGRATKTFRKWNDDTFLCNVDRGINFLGAACNETPLPQLGSCITAISTIITIITIITVIIVTVTITFVNEYNYHNHYYQCYGSEILEGIGSPSLPPRLWG